MYMFYLVSAVALSTGISTFAQYDTLSRAKDDARSSRIQVTSEQQHVAARTLRRDFQMNPSAFPAVTPGGYTLLDTSLVSASLRGGYINMDASSFYLSDQGEVIAFLREGTSSPLEGNGDNDLGLTVRPQSVTGFLSWLLGGNFQRGPVLHDNEQSGGSYQTDTSAGLDLRFLSNEVFAEMSSDQVKVVAKLDLNALNYHELAGGVTDVLQSSNNATASVVQASFDLPAFSAVQARYSK